MFCARREETKKTPRTRLKPIEYTVLIRFYSILEKCYQLPFFKSPFPIATNFYFMIQIVVRSWFESVLFVCLFDHDVCFVINYYYI